MKALRFILIVFMLYAFKLAVAAPAPSKVESPEKICNECSDTLYLLDGRVIPITYLSETGMKVKFKKCDDPINRNWKKDKVKIEKIVLSSGEVKEYGGNNNGPNTTIDPSAKLIGATAVIVVIGGLTAVGIVTWGILELLSW